MNNFREREGESTHARASSDVPLFWRAHTFKTVLQLADVARTLRKLFFGRRGTESLSTHLKGFTFTASYEQWSTWVCLLPFKIILYLPLPPVQFPTSLHPIAWTTEVLHNNMNKMRFSLMNLRLFPLIFTALSYSYWLCGMTHVGE